MSRDKVWNDFAALPIEAQRQAADVIAFLRAQHAARKTRKTASKSIASEPFVGMWQDRPDMEDSSAWVRETREREWSRSKRHG
jgi:hypothetical protein